jgi:hypothetical protein
MLSINKIAPRVYHLLVDSRYDLCMLCMRYQETLESTNPRFIDQPFSWVEFMSWYSKEYPSDGAFAYSSDWSGFNMPFDVVKEVHQRGIPDMNMYDYIMIGLYDMINVHDQHCYLIGSSPESDVLSHEMIHALFYTNEDYKNRVLGIISEYENTEMYSDVCAKLTQEGYNKKVHNDEINAYAVDDDLEWFEEVTDVKAYHQMKKELISLHKEYFDLSTEETKKTKKKK